MKYSVQIDINVPIKIVLEKFDNPKNAFMWQKGLQKVVVADGHAGEVRSKIGTYTN